MRARSPVDADALLSLWNDVLKSGDIPPSYWVLMTHSHAGIEVRQSAFGELHMLSHLVGTANRTDIRRLVALEKENAELRDKLERQQTRMQEMSAERDTSHRQLNDQALQLERKPDATTAELEAELQRLAEKVEDGERHLALHTSRREVAEQCMHQEEEQTRALRNKLGEAQALLKVVVQAEMRGARTRAARFRRSARRASPRVRMGEWQAHRVHGRPAEFERDASSRWWTRRAAR